MCHFMLPGRVRAPSMPLDGRYADEAMGLLVREMSAAGTRPQEYLASLYGGGNMFPDLMGCRKDLIGSKNAQTAKRLISDYGIRVGAESLEGTGHRKIDFDVTTGKVTVEHKQLPVEPKQCRRCETRDLCYA